MSALVVPLVLAGSAQAVTAATAATSKTVVSSTPAATSTGLVPGLLGTVGTVTNTTLTTVTGLVGALLNPWGDPTTDKVALGADGVNHPEKDPGSLYTLTNAIGARAVWATTDAAGKAITGKGVTVAVLDSGVSPVAGLNGAGKVVNGPDLSLETNSAQLRNLDAFGHGTHLAGIIAAHDPTATTATGAPAPTSPSQELGVAPDAQLLSVKLGTADGSADVSQIIAGLDWVTQHRNDGPTKIRVVNLAFGTDSVQSYQIDPLAAAVENAWRNGIVVVVSGGNEGNRAGRLTDPAIDPYVISVGSSDPNHSVAGWTLPTTSTFSSSGTTQRHVDLLAPGTSLASLRDPGSYIDVNHPEGLVKGDTSGRLFRGSGTSQASAVVSGAVALLLQENPNLTPDQVKAALVKSATLVAGGTPTLSGAGELNVKAAAAYVKRWPLAPTKAQSAAIALEVGQLYLPATGTGSLEAARGGVNLVDPTTGAKLQGEVDIHGKPWNGRAWEANAAVGKAWTGGSWNGSTWSGSSWNGPNWVSANWTGTDWAGQPWGESDWDAARWAAARWAGSSWDAARWAADEWHAARWAGAEWF